MSHALRELVPGCAVHCLDLGSEYVTHGSVARLHQKHGLDPASIAKKLTEVLKREN